MKAITILQPWASLIACGHKKIETRGWGTNYRGPIAIHAGKAMNPAQKEACVTADKALGIVENGSKWYYLRHGVGDFGKVIAIADLVDCVKVTGFDKFANSPILERREWLLADFKECAFGDYAPGRYAWVLENVRQIDPVPVRGQQGIWNWEGGK